MCAMFCRVIKYGESLVEKALVTVCYVMQFFTCHMNNLSKGLFHFSYSMSTGKLTSR